MKSKKLIEETVNPLMKTIRNNALPSICISNFEALLTEISDDEVVRIVASDMNSLIEELMILFREVDKMGEARFKARIITDNFIQPGRFFKRTTKIVKKYIRLMNLINDEFTPSNKVIFQINSNHKVEDLTGFVDTQSVDNSEWDCVNVKNYRDYRELSRKVILLWNYIPAIIKSLIQTERRKLNLDNNSIKFD
jgi:hypothetical protein